MTHRQQDKEEIMHWGLQLIGLLALLLLQPRVVAQNIDDELPVLDLDTPIRMNFSGNWEKDFARSDNWEDELSRRMRIRQENAALQRSGIGLGGGPTVSLGNINLNQPRRRQANLLELARLSEYINRNSTMEIFQDRNEIRIERRGEAPLVCGMETGPTQTFQSQHGAEICGWDRNQLVFEMALPAGLYIIHRFSVSADSQILQMITSISSNGSVPFNLVQSFNKYQAPPDQYNCRQTVTRGRVCSQRTPLN
ncbi:MAG: hypothetical protein OXU66_07610 [Gammaproteobacteria bacterium]|nr:hypothetical protein [Gammaproteobacteria bacterium]MDD9895861.1 hypothetical protein [Gammaproteobacteria bacterium]MDD9958792.1 hypothetical protein [Gammaproteobacteria bacterium]